MGQLANSGRLLRQARFPRSALVVANVLFAHALLLPSLAVLVALQLWYGCGPTVHLGGLVAVWLPGLALGCGLALAAAAVNAYARDTEHLVDYLLRVVFLVSPGFYPVDLVPAQLRPWYELLPSTALFEGTRDCVMRGRMPELAPLAVLWAASLLALFLGFRVFGRLERGLVKAL